MSIRLVFFSIDVPQIVLISNNFLTYPLEYSNIFSIISQVNGLIEENEALKAIQEQHETLVDILNVEKCQMVQRLNENTSGLTVQLESLQKQADDLNAQNEQLIDSKNQVSIHI